MWGADDPDCRKPMLWEDLTYDPEQAHPLNLDRPTNTVKRDDMMFRFYQKWVALRSSYPVLQKGDFRWLLTGNNTRVLAFERTYQGSRLMAVFNAGKLTQNVSWEKIGVGGFSAWTTIEGGSPGPTIKIEANSFAVYINKTIQD